MSDGTLNIFFSLFLILSVLLFSFLFSFLIGETIIAVTDYDCKLRRYIMIKIFIVFLFGQRHRQQPTILNLTVFFDSTGAHVKGNDICQIRRKYEKFSKSKNTREKRKRWTFNYRKSSEHDMNE